MPEFNFDQYKSAWKEQDIPRKYSEGQILDVLNHRSKNNVKYILWIGVLEFALFLGLIVFYLITGEKDDFSDLFKALGIRKSDEYQKSFEQSYFLLKVVSLLLTGTFVVLFYLKYKAIKVESQLTAFIQQLLRFRKTVQLFVWLNIGMVCLFMLGGTWLLYDAIKSESMGGQTVFALLIASVVAIIFSLLLAWIYYRIVYGILLRKLSKHLKNLQEMEKTLEENMEKG